MADSALDIITGFLAQYGLPASLGTWAEAMLRNPEMTPDRIIMELRNQPEYKQRFPAMEELSKRGQALSEAEYVEYEKSVASLAQQYGMPGEMFGRDYMKDMLLSNVSVREFEERIGMAAEASQTAPPEVRQAFAQMYGFGSQGAMTAYFLDPDEALPVITRRYEAAQIGGAATRYRFGIQTEELERLAEQGVDYGQAMSGFSKARQLERLAVGTGETATEEEIALGTFGGAEQRRKVERVQASRKAQFGDQGTGATREGVSGLGNASA